MGLAERGRGCWRQPLFPLQPPLRLPSGAAGPFCWTSLTIYVLVSLLSFWLLYLFGDRSGMSELEGKRNSCPIFLNVKAKQSTKKEKKKTYKNIMGHPPMLPHYLRYMKCQKYNDQTFYTVPFLPTRIYVYCSSFSTHLSFLKLHSAESPVIIHSFHRPHLPNYTAILYSKEAFQKNRHLKKCICSHSSLLTLFLEIITFFFNHKKDCILAI